MNALTEVVQVVGIAATVFCGYKAHRAGKVIPDAVKLIEDLSGDSKAPSTETEK